MFDNLSESTLRIVIDMTVQGIRPERMRELLREKRGIEVSEEDMLRYQLAAAVHFNQAADVNQTQALGLAVERLNFIYNQALAQNALKLALSAQAELNRLLKLKPESPDEKHRDHFDFDLQVPSIPCRS